jgi:GT2 family glycosyltransferase
VAAFPGVRLIANPKNLGFTGGMNTGLRAASGDCVCLTEDDITLEPATLAALVGHIERNPDVLAGGLMLNSSTGTIRCAGGRFKIGSRFELEVIGENQPDDGRFTEPFAVGYLPGAFLFAGRAVWDRLGGFRDLYFLYMEDVDLALRAAATGVRLDMVPAARVRHTDPTPGREPAWLACLKARNLLRLYVLNAPARVLPLALLRLGVWGVIRDLARLQPAGWHMLWALAATALELPRLLCQRRRGKR